MSCRDEIVRDLRRRLVGPGLGAAGEDGTFEQEVIDGRLSLAYMMGMLFPRNEPEDVARAGDEAESVDEDPDDPLSMATAMLPSSMGLSVCVSAGSLVEVTIQAARYEPLGGAASETTGATTEHTGKRRKAKQEARWRRVPLADAKVEVDPRGLPPTPVLEGRAALEVLARSLADGSILLTASVSNTSNASNRSAEETLFQVEISITPRTGEILQYPSATFLPPTDDERELRVIYGEQRPYAAGHGVATTWELEGGTCSSVRTEAIPTAHVWRPVFDNLSVGTGTSQVKFPDDGIFLIAPLARGDDPPEVLSSRLEKLVEFYEQWIETQGAIAVDAYLQPDADRMIDRCRQSARRMREGIRLLASNRDVARCFMLANRAMLMSMGHAARAAGRGRADYKQGPFELGTAETATIDYYASTAAWRPFQLAFFLQVLPSLAGKDLPDRDIVDVIWFATGGGKTEAYLLVSAFELLRRRLMGAEGGGTGVINRYTYRFLTADQFQRTAGVICALELVRRQLASDGDQSLGTEEFSIGLFVGGEVSPNDLAEGNEKLLELLDAKDPRSANPFPIESCPSCGTLLVPSSQRRLPDGSPDRSYYGFAAASNAFRVFCPEEDCPFHDSLPVYFVDELLYQHPPSFLLGTVDKFAMVPWKHKGGRLFGVGTGKLAPSLVIQDELHLISGPLGTLAGIYEAAFETLIESTGSPPPKVIASTATIRNAGVQCRRIYGRPSAVFPAPGIRAEDSFFSKLDVGNVDRSRLYAGVMAQGLRATIAASWTIAALLQGVHEREELGASPDELDAYWTLVAYHNSKRELGRIANATRDEIPTRMKVYAACEAKERASNFRVLELKAHSETPVPQARQMLARRHTAAEPAIDIVPCTNIISVGVDIDRLGLMLVNGQPKLSAEYIQATSRVGRGQVPGLVVACYSPSKPRDRSHYESFRDYHERFYSFVEPTSVTPGALPAIDRALHAALVIAVRHGTALTSNSAAKNFDPAIESIAAVIERLRGRLQASYVNDDEEEERERLSNKLTEKVEQWRDWAKNLDGLQYCFARGQKKPCLLVRFGDRKTDNAGWQTLQSMRHVDKEIILEDSASG
ncbi:helicase-related protein [Sphingomonas limnosediminicola]|uniref:Helicase-related protein n=1 Tax=Sphingomonas limnosediminicola TaxID=940133 RepID=A0ABP7L6Q9_9SPHN